MRGFVIRMLIGALGLWVASELVPGMRLADPTTLVLAAALLGVVNAVVRPLLVLLTLPITLLTLGGFLLVVNALMLALVAWLLPGFSLAGFVPALLGSLVVSFVAWLSSWWIGPRGRVEVMVARTARRS